MRACVHMLVCVCVFACPCSCVCVYAYVFTWRLSRERRSSHKTYTHFYDADRLFQEFSKFAPHVSTLSFGENDRTCYVTESSMSCWQVVADDSANPGFQGECVCMLCLMLICFDTWQVPCTTSSSSIIITARCVSHATRTTLASCTLSSSYVMRRHRLALPPALLPPPLRLLLLRIPHRVCKMMAKRRAILTPPLPICEACTEYKTRTHYYVFFCFEFNIESVQSDGKEMRKSGVLFPVFGQ